MIFKKYIKAFFSVISVKEKMIFYLLLLTFIASSLFMIGYFLTTHTQISPAFGGSFREGVLGQPRYINPVYSEANFSRRADREYQADFN